MQRYDGDVSGTPRRYMLNTARFWAGIVPAAVVAALVAVVVVLITRGLFDVPVLAPRSHGVWGDARTANYAIGAALATVLAAALMHVLTVEVIEPRQYFVWIMSVATLITMIMPLTLVDDLGSKIATALVNLTIGVVITGIVHRVTVATRTPWVADRRGAVAPTQQWAEPPAYYLG
jgi:hypothetical protein